jgi:hypothetical protein
MLRCILAIVLGYAVMAVLVMVAFLVVIKLAPDFAYVAGRCEASLGFCLFGLLASAIAAVIGGVVASVVARGALWPVKVLAGLIVILGLLSSIQQMRRDPPNVTTEEVTRMGTMERALKSVQPTWYALLMPFVGGAGVFAGGAVRNRRKHRTGGTPE